MKKLEKEREARVGYYVKLALWPSLPNKRKRKRISLDQITHQQISSSSSSSGLLASEGGETEPTPVFECVCRVLVEWKLCVRVWFEFGARHWTCCVCVSSWAWTLLACWCWPLHSTCSGSKSRLRVDSWGARILFSRALSFALSVCVCLLARAEEAAREISNKRQTSRERERNYSKI